MIFYSKQDFNQDMILFRKMVLRLHSRKKLLKLFFYESWSRFSLEVTVVNIIEDLDLELGVENNFSEFFQHTLQDSDVWLSGSKYLYRLTLPKNKPKHNLTCATLDNFF